MPKDLIIFDVDGVLRDSARAGYEGLRRGFASAGINPSFSMEEMWNLRGLGKYNDRLNCIMVLVAASREGIEMGRLLTRSDAEQRIDALVSKNGIDAGRKLAENISSIYQNFFLSPEARSLIGIFPYVQVSLRTLKSSGYTLAIFTNSSIVSVRRDLAALDMSVFSAVLAEEDVKNKKPSGEGITKVMQMLSFAPYRTYYVGDAISDVLAARDAGCRAVTVLSGMGTKYQLESAKPDMIFTDISAMSMALASRRKLRSH